jgi:hypothetical protein
MSINLNEHPNMATTKTKHLLPGSISEAQLRDAKMMPIGADFVLVRINSRLGSGTVRAADKAEVLVNKAAVALRKPGIDKASVFRGATPQKVFAYSALPGDTSKVVRESFDGTRLVGRFGLDGRFRASSKAG